MDEQPDDLSQYKGSFELLRSMGMGGGELTDFIKTYGIEVAAVQLKIKPVVLKKFLLAANDLAHVASALREVQLRRSGKRVVLSPAQRTNFNGLVDNIRALVGTQPMARRLGMSRQAIYAIVADGGPKSVTFFVAGVAQMLNYNTMTGFLAALQEGVPGTSSLVRKDFRVEKPTKPRKPRKRKVKVTLTPEAT